MDLLCYPPLGFLSLPLATCAVCKFKINLQILLSASCWSTPKRQVCFNLSSCLLQICFSCSKSWPSYCRTLYWCFSLIIRLKFNFLLKSLWAYLVIFNSTPGFSMRMIKILVAPNDTHFFPGLPGPSACLHIVQLSYSVFSFRISVVWSLVVSMRIVPIDLSV